MNHPKIYKKAIDIIVTAGLYILLLALVVGLFRLLLDIPSVFASGGDGFTKVVSGVLSLFIVIELFQTFAEYSAHERIKLTYMTDATILIVMREVIIGLYSYSFKYDMLLALSSLLLVLGLIRVFAVKYSPEKFENKN